MKHGAALYESIAPKQPEPCQFCAKPDESRDAVSDHFIFACVVVALVILAGLAWSFVWTP